MACGHLLCTAFVSCQLGGAEVGHEIGVQQERCTTAPLCNSWAQNSAQPNSAPTSYVPVEAEREACVYMISHEAPDEAPLVKIGTTTRDPRVRAQEVGGVLLASVRGNAVNERWLHVALAAHRATAEAKRRRLPHEQEWFYLRGPVRTVVAAAAAGASAEQLRAIVTAATPTPEPEVRAYSPPPKAMTAADRAKLAKRICAEVCRRSLSEFVRRGWHVLEPGVALEWNWHIQALCDHVQWMLEGWLRVNGHRTHPTWQRRAAAFVQNLVINVPPGTLKSRILMVFAPAWMWLHCPTWTVCATSGNPDNVTRDSDAHRDLVTSAWYRETFEIKWSIRDDIDAKAKWSNTAGGSRVSRGLISKFTGIHVDAIFLDDPDDAHEVYSEAARKRVHSKWTKAIKNRVNSTAKSIRIAIQQRVHEDDWTAAIALKQLWHPTKRPLGWAWLCLAMELGKGPEVPDDYAGSPWGWVDPRTSPGEVLHPSRFPPEVLADELESHGPHGYEAQYNQNPSALAGGMWETAWWRFWRPESGDVDTKRPPGCVSATDVPARKIPCDASGVPVFQWWAISVDCSFKETADGSRVSIGVWGGIGVDRFLVHDSTKPRGFTATLDDLRAIKKAYPKAGKIYIEDKANGPAVIDTLKKEMTGIIEIEPDGGKESRAFACEPAIASGHVYLLEGAGWLKEYVHEVSAFPNGKWDDRVDMTSQLLNVTRGKRVGFVM